MKKKHSMSLLEIMVVVFFIGIIASLLAVNIKGSMEKGKAFKTEMAQRQIKDILLLEAAKEDKELTEVSEKAAKYLKKSGLVKDVNAMLKDGWGEPFVLSVDKNELHVVSKRLDQYKLKNG